MTADTTIPAQIIEFIHSEELTVGSHLSAQSLANRLQVSRSPINKALELLEQKGVVKREPNRGCFLAKIVTEPLDEFLQELGLENQDKISHIYFQLADDRLRGLLGNEFSETEIKKRYKLTSAQLQAVLNRISEEGWAYKKPGYGWGFSPMLTTPESLIQTYRLRLALEPAALLEPGYNLDQHTLERCRATELKLLQGNIQSYTANEIHHRGVQFHVALVEASGNPFFIDTIHRIHRIRRLLSYRSMLDRKRYQKHGQQHLQILDLLEQGQNKEASDALRKHLQDTIKNISEISEILNP